MRLSRQKTGKGFDRNGDEILKIKQWLKRHLTTLILCLILLTGLGLLAYPSFSDYWNSFHQTRAVMSYAENVARMDQKEYERILKSARAYNKKLSKNGIHWTLSDEETAAYEKELNVQDSGIMGYITIDKIRVMLPIYHGTGEAVLQTSIGHLAETSLPVGGKTTHCVLSGHRGLPSAKLFTDLDKLVEGDTFTLFAPLPLLLTAFSTGFGRREPPTTSQIS